MNKLALVLVFSFLAATLSAAAIPVIEQRTFVGRGYGTVTPGGLAGEGCDFTLSINDHGRGTWGFHFAVDPRGVARCGGPLFLTGTTFESARGSPRTGFNETWETPDGCYRRTLETSPFGRATEVVYTQTYLCGGTPSVLGLSGVVDFIMTGDVAAPVPPLPPPVLREAHVAAGPGTYVSYATFVDPDGNTSSLSYVNPHCFVRAELVRGAHGYELVLTSDPVNAGHVNPLDPFGNHSCLGPLFGTVFQLGEDKGDASTGFSYAATYETRFEGEGGDEIVCVREERLTTSAFLAYETSLVHTRETRCSDGHIDGVALEATLENLLFARVP